MTTARIIQGNCCYDINDEPNGLCYCPDYCECACKECSCDAEAVPLAFGAV